MIKNNAKFQEALIAKKKTHLDIAIKDTVTYLSPAFLENGDPSEIHWLNKFTKLQTITAGDIRQHKQAWQIQYVRADRFQNVADAIKAAIPNRPKSQDFRVIGDAVEKVARDIGRATNPETGKRHIVWASKILHHAWPTVRTFITDTYAGAAVSLWAKYKIGAATRWAWAEEGEYVCYLRFCDRYLMEIMATKDFQVALQEVEAELAKISIERSPMMSSPDFRARIGDFVARRLFDKFLLQQGKWILSWKAAQKLYWDVEF